MFDKSQDAQRGYFSTALRKIFSPGDSPPAKSRLEAASAGLKTDSGIKEGKTGKSAGAAGKAESQKPPELGKISCVVGADMV
ncbi:hypothetical protein AALA80_05590 [Oscillospiraceae bacterium 50-60]